MAGLRRHCFLNQPRLGPALVRELELIDCEPTPLQRQLTLIPSSILAADAHALDLLTLPLIRISS